MTKSLPEEFLASLRWRTAAEGGRTSGPPQGLTYYPTVVFALGQDAEVLPGWPATGEHFSVAVRFSVPPTDGQGQAYVRFLVPEAAAEEVSVGARFFVMEGPRVVAEGVVLALAQ